MSLEYSTGALPSSDSGMLAGVELLGPLIEVAAILDGITPPFRDPAAIRDSLREGAREIRSVAWKRTRMVNKSPSVERIRANVEMVLGRMYLDPVFAREKIERELAAGLSSKRITERLLLAGERYGKPAVVRQPPDPALLTAEIEQLQRKLTAARLESEQRFPLVVRALDGGSRA